MPFINLDGARLFYLEAGSGEPSLLFVHGVGGSSRHWERQLAYFRQLHRVVAIDLPGCGRSDPSPLGHSVEASAVVIARAIEALELASPVIVGHSYGGFVALRYHLSESRRDRALVIVDSFVGYGNSPFTRRLSRRLAIERGKRFVLGALLRLTAFPSFVAGRDLKWWIKRQYNASSHSIGYLGAAIMQIESLFPDREIELAWREPVPILLVSRPVDRDRDEVVTRFANEIPDVQVTKLGPVGHEIMISAVTEFNGILASFLAGLKDRRLEPGARNSRRRARSRWKTVAEDRGESC